MFVGTAHAYEYKLQFMQMMPITSCTHRYAVDFLSSSS
jgi:hypothetical protein